MPNTQPPPEGARVYIIWPGDGQVIRRGKFWLRMGLSGAGVAPAGIDKPNTGHHHVLIDTELPALDREIPNDKNHLHFGRGQTEARIELPPGSAYPATAIRRREPRSTPAAALFQQDYRHCETLGEL